MAGSELVVRVRDSLGNNVDSFGGGGSTASPSVTSEKTPANLATGQIAVTTSATQIVPTRAGRKSLILTPTSATVFYVGPTGVTTATGIYVAAGASITLATEAAVFAVGSAALTVSYAETF